MKLRRKTAALLLALTCALAGCSAQNVSLEGGDGLITDSDAARAAAQQSGMLLSFPMGQLRRLSWYYDSYGAGNGRARYNLVNGPKDGYLLLKTDYAALAQTCVCAVPGCAHDGPQCPAWVEKLVSVYSIGDKIYLCCAADVSGLGSGRAPDGAWVDELGDGAVPRRRVAQLPENWRVTFQCTDGDALYGTYLETGEESERNIYHGVRLGLSDGVYQTWDYAQNEVPIGCIDSGIVVLRRVYPAGFDPASAPNADAYNAGYSNTRFLYYSINLATGQRRLLAELPYNGGMGENSCIWNNALYWIDYHNGEFVTLQKYDTAQNVMRQLGGRYPRDLGMELFYAEGADGTQGRYLRVRYDQGAESWNVTEAFLDVTTGELRGVPLKADMDGYQAGVYPIERTNEGDYLVAVGTMPGSGRARYALIAPDKYWAGEPDYRMIEMYPVGGAQ